MGEDNLQLEAEQWKCNAMQWLKMNLQRETVLSRARLRSPGALTQTPCTLAGIQSQDPQDPALSELQQEIKEKEDKKQTFLILRKHPSLPFI